MLTSTPTTTRCPPRRHEYLSAVLDSIDEQLTHEPTIETQNRKEMRPNPLASWELQIGDLRVYYDVAEEPQTVTVVAIGIKRGNRVFIGGREMSL